MTAPSSSATKSAWLIAGAIVLAGALVGLGLYLGLRQGAGRDVAQVPVAPTMPVPAAAAPEPVPLHSAVPPEPPGIASDTQERVDLAVANALAARHSAFVERCWKPSVAQSTEPASQVFRVRMLFDAKGRKTDHAVSDAPDPRRADVADCLRKLDIELSIPPPGEMVGSQRELTLP
jgi:hypothetical protein